ncbi:MAG TPA: hypothetical protein VFI34_07720 [Candidatus Limnocylindrales bacterium]|nr:hypothetical protein [Candidatus Limnocylindrales bacterium]
MTATAELVRIAARVVPPVGASQLVATVDVEPCGRLSNGVPSGVVVEADGTKRPPRTTYGVAWLVDGRVRTDPFATFDRGDDAYHLIRILEGEVATPRPAAHRGEPLPRADASASAADPELRPEPPREPSAVPFTPAIASGHAERSTATEPGSGSTAASMSGTCPVCGDPMPPAGHGQRRLTCSDRCRTARARAQRAASSAPMAPDTTPAAVTASRARASAPRSARHFVAAAGVGGSAEGRAVPGAAQTELGF